MRSVALLGPARVALAYRRGGRCTLHRNAPALIAAPLSLVLALSRVLRCLSPQTQVSNNSVEEHQRRCDRRGHPSLKVILKVTHRSLKTSLYEPILFKVVEYHHLILRPQRLVAATECETSGTALTRPSAKRND
ncbi:hypothetical protein EVAR_39895_1 [Eumeta japonica]|uniref:Uncharacterized protein n=1 Tax=Eumeta variegata TaxID=151549 RepID=A0A4C1WLV1_EUMVA|nr:hypothetical protein EVAR_39895_1 [Eumeta japonica]